MDFSDDDTEASQASQTQPDFLGYSHALLEEAYNTQDSIEYELPQEAIAPSPMTDAFERQMEKYESGLMQAQLNEGPVDLDSLADNLQFVLGRFLSRSLTLLTNLL